MNPEVLNIAMGILLGGGSLLIVHWLIGTPGLAVVAILAGVGFGLYHVWYLVDWTSLWVWVDGWPFQVKYVAFILGGCAFLSLMCAGLGA